MSRGLPAIEAREVSYKYRRGGEVLKGVSIAIQPGEFVGILGPNGSGKTTFLRLLSGVLKPDSGTVKLFGEEVWGLGRQVVARRVGVVPQRTSIEFPILGLDVVLMGRYPHRSNGLFSRPTKGDIENATNVLRALDASHLASKEANGLSGGETALLAIARALIQASHIILADEATSSLDPRRKLQVFDLFSSLNTEAGLTIVSVMHDVNLAALYCKRLVFFKDGRIAHDGLVHEVLTKENLMDIYNVEVEIVTHPRRGVVQVLMG